MTAAERRQAILEAIVARRHDKRENLAHEFGVSTRTIERDIAVLTLSYPIVAYPGRYGGIYLTSDTFHLNHPRPNIKEKALIEKILRSMTGEDRKTFIELSRKYGWRVDENAC